MDIRLVHLLAAVATSGAAVLLLACASGTSLATYEAPLSPDAPDSGTRAVRDSAARERAGEEDRVVERPQREGGHEAALPDAVASGDETANDDGGVSEASTCKGTVVLAGGTSSVAFGAASVDGAPWTVTSLSSGSASSNPALVPFGGGFVALFTAAGTDNLLYSTYGSSSWSTPSNASATSCSGPAKALGGAGLAAIGTTLHSVYLGTDNDLFHGSYTLAGWDCESDPLTCSGGSQSWGPSASTTANVGASLVVAFDGYDQKLYSQSLTSGVWAAAATIAGASVGTISPTLVAMNGGSSELLLVYENAADNKLYSVTRTSGTWGTPQLANAAAFTMSPVSLAPMAGGRALVVFLGTDGNPYSMTFDPTATTPWSAPVAIVTGVAHLSTPPTVAAGICGVDAIAALVQPTGVELVTLSSGAWSSPTLVGTTTSMTFATIATAP